MACIWILPSRASLYVASAFEARIRPVLLAALELPKAFRPSISRTGWQSMQELPAVANGLIFAMEKSESTVAKSKEYAGLKNGLEPMLQEDKTVGIKKLSDKDD